MCLIIDANVGNLVSTPAPAPDYAPIWEALVRGRAVAIHGGRLSLEYIKLSAVGRRLLLELGRRGRVRTVDATAVEEATREFSRRVIRSDDPHVLGLAQVSQVRPLCTDDKELHADFTNPALLQPSGSIYQTADHAHLIHRHCSQSGRRRGSALEPEDANWLIESQADHLPRHARLSATTQYIGRSGGRSPSVGRRLVTITDSARRRRG